MRCAVALLALSACGRLGFSDGTAIDAGDISDADGDADASDPCARATTAPATIHITGTTFRYLNFDNSLRMPLVGAKVEGLLGSATTIGSTTSDANGAYDLAITTGGLPVPLTISYRNASDFETRVVFAPPLERDVAAPGAQVWQLGDGPIWNATAMSTIYSDLGITRDPNRSTLNIAVRDCLGAPVAGATVTIQPPPEVLAYQADSGVPSQALTETQGMFAHAFGFNAVPGSTTITVTHAEHTFDPVTVDVTGGQFNTLAVARTRE